MMQQVRPSSTTATPLYVRTGSRPALFDHISVDPRDQTLPTRTSHVLARVLSHAPATHNISVNPSIKTPAAASRHTDDCAAAAAWLAPACGVHTREVSGSRAVFKAAIGIPHPSRPRVPSTKCLASGCQSERKTPRGLRRPPLALHAVSCRQTPQARHQRNAKGVAPINKWVGPDILTPLRRPDGATYSNRATRGFIHGRPLRLRITCC